MPDLPGYGASVPIPQNDKVSAGIAILEALKTAVAEANKGINENVKIILIGHDRGARTAHHITVSGVQGVDILGVCLIDIVSFLFFFLRLYARRAWTLIEQTGPHINTMATLHQPIHRRKRNHRLLPLAAPRKRRSSNPHDHRLRRGELVSGDDSTLVG